jgi:hypothetical protein
MHIRLSGDLDLAQDIQVYLIRDVLHTTLCCVRRASDLHLISFTYAYWYVIEIRSNPIHAYCNFKQ